MITFSYDCPYCKSKNVAFEVGDFGRRERKSQDKDVFAILATCNNCGGGIVTNVVVSKTITDVGYFGYKRSVSDETLDLLMFHQNKKYSLSEVFPNQELVFHPEPPKPDIPEHLPEELAVLFLEAEELYCLVADGKFLKQAGASYRAVIELALSKLDDNPADKNLNQRINQLAKQGKLSSSMEKFAHRIRSLGNSASHALLEFSRKDLDDIRLFTRLFLIYSFTLPSLIPEDI